MMTDRGCKKFSCDSVERGRWMEREREGEGERKQADGERKEYLFRVRESR